MRRANRVKTLPIEAIVLAGLDLDDGGKRIRRSRTVLMLAELLPATVLHRLRDRGAELVTAKSGVDALSRLAASGFDAVIIELSGDGPHVIHAVKENVEYLEASDRSRIFADSVAKIVAEARLRHRMTPFFVARPRVQGFQICVAPPEHVYEETGNGISLADAVMCLDVGKLLRRGQALA